MLLRPDVVASALDENKQKGEKIIYLSPKGKQFDLFVRSAIPFTKSMRRDLNKIFSECIEITGLSGNIIMQSALQFIDIPVPQLTSNYGSGVVV